MQRGDLIVKRFAALIKASQVLRQRVVEENAVDVRFTRRIGGRLQLLQHIEQSARIAIRVTDNALSRILGKTQTGHRHGLRTLK